MENFKNYKISDFQFIKKIKFLLKKILIIPSNNQTFPLSRFVSNNYTISLFYTQTHLVPSYRKENRKKTTRRKFMQIVALSHENFFSLLFILTCSWNEQQQYVRQQKNLQRGSTTFAL